MTKPKVKMTKEGSLTDLFDKYCHKKDIPFFAGVNGPRIEGWSHIPDRVMGEPKDDLLTKCIIIEIKPTKEGAVNDLKSKEEYKTAKFLAAIYFENGKPCGSLHSWRRPTGELGFEEVLGTCPLNKFIDVLYSKVYKPAVNPDKVHVVNVAIKLATQYSQEEIFNVMSGSFAGEPKPADLGYSLNVFWSLCDKITRPGDKVGVLHDVVFAPDTHKERHKLGQFITEYPHSLHIAEKVIEIFNDHQDLMIYEPCVGTGAIACELLTLLFRKYGKRKSRKIMKEQLKFADIGPRMRVYATVVLKLHTEKLFGEGNGIHFKIEKNDLETDSFDLSKMIVYGNYPFNKGTDYNYLAKIFRQQMKCGLSLGVFMGDSATFDPRKAQSKKVLGEDFYTWIKEEYSTTDFKEVAVKISVISFDRGRKSVQSVMNAKFVSLGSKLSISRPFNFIGCDYIRFKDKTPIYSTAYNPANSIPYLHQKELELDIDVYEKRVPDPEAPAGSKEREIYERWMKERGKYPPIKVRSFLGIGVYTKSNKIPVRYFKNLAAILTSINVVEGNEKLLGVVGLIFTSIKFTTALYKYFPLWHSANALYTTNMKKFPIPKNIPDRLYEIGEELIIKGKEDQALRDEADGIVEELYKGLEI